METWVEGGARHVRVGRKTYKSTHWRNFLDFLLFFIQHTFGKGWHADQAAIGSGDAHPVYKQLLELKNAEVIQSPRGAFYSVQTTGQINALISLAYDLYICEHNHGIPRELIRRLRNKDEYEGALYEAHVAGLFSRAGFSLEFEDEKDKRRTHCEFTATNNGTGQRFAVEAKAVTTRSSRAGDASSPPNFRGKLFDALSKHADHRRMIFIEVNRRIAPNEGSPEWAPHLREQLFRAERDMVLEDGRRPEKAYVFVTNRPLLSQAEAPDEGYQGAAAGFLIRDFPPESMGHLRHMHRARMKHMEAYQLFCAMSHSNPTPQHFQDDSFATLFRGMMREPSQDDIQHPFDAFDFVFSTYSRTDPAKLRDWLAGHIPDEKLARMNGLQLAEEYSAGIGQSIMRDIVGRNRVQPGAGSTR